MLAAEASTTSCVWCAKNEGALTGKLRAQYMSAHQVSEEVGVSERGAACSTVRLKDRDSDFRGGGGCSWGSCGRGLSDVDGGPDGELEGFGNGRGVRLDAQPARPGHPTYRSVLKGSSDLVGEHVQLVDRLLEVVQGSGFVHANDSSRGARSLIRPIFTISPDGRQVSARQLTGPFI